MSKSNFTEFYNQEEILEEDILKALAGKIGTAAMNIFRNKSTKHINISMDYLKIFKPIDIKKYDKTLDKLATDFQNNKTFGKNIVIQDIRVGDFTAGGLFDSSVNAINKAVPHAADSDNTAWKNKEHAPAVTVYLLSNGGKLSLWNIPSDTTEEDKPYNANNRVYAIGMNSTAEKAFMLMFGMGFKDWLSRQQFADDTAKTKEDQKTKAVNQEESKNVWKGTAEISKQDYDKLYAIQTESFKEGAVEDIVEIKPTDTVKAGKIWDCINPKGKFIIYITKDKKYKAGWSDDTIRQWVNKAAGIKIPSGTKVVHPESIQLNKEIL